MKRGPFINKLNIQIDPESKPHLLVDLFYMKNKKKKPVVIFTHGFKSFKDWGPFNLLASHFAEKGFVFVKYNLSHNGTTFREPDKIIEPELFGRNTVETELEDMDQVIHFLLHEPSEFYEELDPNELILIGHSRGGSVSILKAHEDIRIKKLITWAAFNDFKKTWSRFYDLDEWKEKGVNYRENRLTGESLPLYYSVYENFLANEERFNIRKAIENLKIPVLVIHGIEDEFIPYEEAFEMKKWNKNINFSIIPYATHNFGGKHPYNTHTLPDDLQIVCDETISFIKILS